MGQELFQFDLLSAGREQVCPEPPNGGGSLRQHPVLYPLSREPPGTRQAALCSSQNSPGTCCCLALAHVVKLGKCRRWSSHVSSAHPCSCLTTASLAASSSILSPPTVGVPSASAPRAFKRWQRAPQGVRHSPQVNSGGLLADELLGPLLFIKYHFAHLTSPANAGPPVN